jgi:hypothetical protein
LCTSGARAHTLARAVVGHANSQAAYHKTETKKDECQAVAELRGLPTQHSTDRSQQGLHDLAPSVKEYPERCSPSRLDPPEVGVIAKPEEESELVAQRRTRKRLILEDSSTFRKDDL